MTRVRLSYLPSLALASLTLVLGACARQSDPIVVTARPLVETVYASGKVMPVDYYTLNALTDGYVTALPVAENDTVRNGAVIARLSSREQDLRLLSAERAYETARLEAGRQGPQLAELRANLISAEAKWRQDSLTRERYRRLSAERATSQANLDRAETEATASFNTLQALRERMRGAQAQIDLQLATAQANLGISEEQQGYAVLRSRFPGRVYQLYKQAGDLVRRNEAVALLGHAHHTFLQLSVDEKDILRVREGMKVLVRIDAYPGRDFAGRVTRIYPMLQSSDQTFRVDASLDQPLPRPLGGLTVEANLVVTEKARALTLPRAVIVGDSVRVRRDGEVKWVKVSLGVQNFDYAEILSGLAEGDEVVAGKQ